MDEPIVDSVSSKEKQLWKAAAQLLVDELHVSADYTLAAYGRLQVTIRDATENISLPSDQKDRIVTHSSLLPMPRSLPRWVWSTCAGLILGIAAIVAGRRVVDIHPGSRTSVPVSVYTTERGQRANVILPDGDTVALNVASRLEVPVNYLAGNHTVVLTGEAIYHVAHHTGAPFTVIAGGTRTRVLGTTFLVRRYPTDTATTVTVREGRVAVHSVVVSALQQATMTDGGVVRLQPADLKQFSFADGVMTLNGVPLSQAIAELNRWYDADIRLGDSAVQNHVLDATFVAGSLSDLSEVLTLALNVRVVRNGRVLTLYTR